MITEQNSSLSFINIIQLFIFWIRHRLIPFEKHALELLFRQISSPERTNCRCITNPRTSRTSGPRVSARHGGCSRDGESPHLQAGKDSRLWAEDDASPAARWPQHAGKTHRFPAYRARILYAAASVLCPSSPKLHIVVCRTLSGVILSTGGSLQPADGITGPVGEYFNQHASSSQLFWHNVFFI